MIETFIPTSSHLDRVDYDSETQELTITFKDGTEYLYRSVPNEVYLGLQHARSAGQYFDRQIKNVYAYEEQ